MYYRTLALFCLLGMASSEGIDSLTACLTEDQSLKMECTFTPPQTTSTPVCTFEADKKVLASTNNKTKPVESSIKNPGKATLTENTCVLIMTNFTDDQGKMYNCTIHYEKPYTKGTKVAKKDTAACSAGDTLMHGGVTLLLALVLPVLSGLL